MKAVKIINSNLYQNLISSIQEKIKLKILTEYRDTTASRDEQKLNLAGLSKDEALKLLENDKDAFIYFALLKMQKFENVKVEEEYPVGKES